jgi:chaperonin GroES
MYMTKIQPLSDRVLLRAIEKNSWVTDSWIYIPDSPNKEKSFLYEVIAVWPGKKDSEMTVSIWDQVLCGQYSWDEVKLEKEEYKIVAQEYVLAIVK